MSEISLRTKGNFYYVKDKTYIEGCYLNCMNYMLTAFAFHAHVQLFLGKNMVFKETKNPFIKYGEGNQTANIEIGTLISEMDKPYLL